MSQETREIVLEVQGLHVTIGTREGRVEPVKDVSFQVSRGETLCVVGESGCGKTMTALALMGLLPAIASIRASRLRFQGKDVLGGEGPGITDLRGNRIAMIFQDPMTALDPSYTIGHQLMEVHKRHLHGKESRSRALFLLERVGIPDAERRMRQYPHELSGGLRQRVMIAMALMSEPDLLIADEPTTALDVSVQAQLLSLLSGLQREMGLAIIFITHDLGVVAQIADRVAVMYAGEIVELADCESLLGNPLHPYTQALLRCIPPGRRGARVERLGILPGLVPHLLDDIRGCRFRGRCAHQFEQCASADLKTNLETNGYRCLLSPSQARANIEVRVHQ